ncbi:hypothetical protein CPB84DRAFT_1846630 [Gymnopilus junonius]|uniref:Uncharacterized protein n=1 Tax=Gymnopilus junonius TaxID=109634 RepID=A0A9P5TPJ2_GYMJU|nr:hypothetical protein CPB84DRAFT_1846630 [Gymnopilus junonius]
MSDQTLGTTGRWLQSKFKNIYESSSPEESDFRTQVSFVFHKDVEIFHNHQKVTLGTFQDSLSQANFAQSRASIEWKEVFEVPPAEGETESSIVAGSFVVTRSMKFRIRAGPAQRLSHNIFSVKIEQDKSIPADDEGSQFRITHMFITSVEKAAPIHMAQMHLPGIAKTDPEP